MSALGEVAACCAEEPGGGEGGGDGGGEGGGDGGGDVEGCVGVAACDRCVLRSKNGVQLQAGCFADFLVG